MRKWNKYILHPLDLNKISLISVKEFLKVLLPIGIVVLFALSFPVADLVYFGRKRRKFEKEVNAMHWKLDPEQVEFSKYMHMVIVH